MSNKILGSTESGAGAQWVERYVQAVGGMLPTARRADIENEIRSLILDEVEGIDGAGIVSETTAIVVLRRLPNPSEMAAKYGATRALIGPQIYNSYVSVLKLVLFIVLIVNIVAIVAQAIVPSGSVAILGGLWAIATSLLGAAAIVTLVFVLIERAGGPVAEWMVEKEDAPWNVRALPPLESRNRVTLGDMTTNIVTVLVSLIWLNFYVGSDGTIAFFYTAWSPMAVLSAFTVAFIPWLSLLWVGELIVYLATLARQRWTNGIRAILLALLAGETALLLVMLGGQPLAAQSSFEGVVRLVVVAMLLVTLWEICVQVLALLKSKRASSTLDAKVLTQSA